MSSKFKLTKEEFDSLKHDNITKKIYDTIISKIEQRTNEIVRKIASKMSWWDFANLDWDSKESKGYFDPQDYQDYIRITGEFSIRDPYKEEIPTKWLWEDFEDEYLRETGAFKERQRQKEEDRAKIIKARKERLAGLQKTIKSKLTKEELQAITFKK